MSGRSRSISFGFGKDAWDAGLTHIFHDAKNLHQVYAALTVISKLLSVFAIYLTFDLLQTVSPFGVVFLVNAWTSLVLNLLHKPFAKGSQIAFTKKHFVLCALFAFFTATLTVGSMISLWSCGPLRFVLVNRHVEYIVLSVVGIFCFRDTAQQSSARKRGSFIFIAALLILLVFDPPASPAVDADAAQSKVPADNAKAQVESSGYSMRLSMSLLFILTFCELALNTANRRLAAVVGGANRLNAVTSTIATLLLIPVGIPSLINDLTGFTAWYETLSVTLFIALAISVIDSYVGGLSTAQLGVTRTARFAELGTMASTLVLAYAWHTQAESAAFRPSSNTQIGRLHGVPDDHVHGAAPAGLRADGVGHDNARASFAGLDGVALTSCSLFFIAALSLTGAAQKVGQSGRFIGYSSGGLPLYTVNNEAERRGSGLIAALKAVSQFVRANLRNTIDDSRSRRILIYFCLNLSFTVVELLYGVWSNSLGLISDSMHMFFDCSALLLALIAATIARWKPTRTHSFGFSRVEVLSGFVNALFLMLIGVSILCAAARRLFDTPRINADRLITVSVLGLVVNLVGVLLLRDMHGHHGHGHGHSHGHGHEKAPNHKHKKKHAASHGHDCDASHDDHHHDHGNCEDLAHEHSNSPAHHHHHGNANLRGVFLHVLADTLGSVGVIISSLCIHNFGWQWTDPVCSIFIACLVLTSVYPLLVDTAEVLVLRTPRRLEYAWTRALAKIERLPGVILVNRQHFWQHSHEVFCCALHIRLAADANEPFVAQHVTDTIRSLGILHSAVQFEHDSNDTSEDRLAPSTLGWMVTPAVNQPANTVGNVPPVHHAANLKASMNGTQRPSGVQPAGISSATRRAAPLAASDASSHTPLAPSNSEFSLGSSSRENQEAPLSSSFYVVDHADVKDI